MAVVKTRTTKSLLAYVGQTVFMVVTVIGGFLATPLLIRLMGTERFGIFRILNDWMANLALLELGLGGAIAVTLIPAVNDEDDEKAAVTLNEGFRACSSIGALMLAGALLLAVVLPWILPHNQVGSMEIRLAVAAISVTLVTFPASVFRTLFEVRQQGYLISMLLTGQSLITLGLQLAAASLKLGLPGVALATALGQSLTLIVLTYKALRIYPRFWKSPPSNDVKKRLWSVNVAIFVNKTMGRIGLYSDNVIVGNTLGAAAVSSFFLTQRVATTAQTQLQAIGNASWAGLMDLAQRGESERFQSRLVELTSIVSGLGLAALGTVSLLNPYFFLKWMGPKLYAGNAVNTLVCLSAWLWSVQSLWGWPIDASGNSKRPLPYAIASAALNLSVSIAATKLLGMQGPIIGTITAFLCIQSWSMPKILNQVFQVRQTQIVAAALRPLTWGIPHWLVWKTLVASFPPNNWRLLITHALLMGGSGLLLWWRFTCTEEYRHLWSARLRYLIPQTLPNLSRSKASPTHP